VVADGREEAGAAGERGAPSAGGNGERRRRLLLPVGEKESESASGGVRLAAGKEAGAVGRTWWPTKVRPPRRMRATRRPNAAGVPRRRSVAVCVRGRGTGAGRGMTRGRAGPALVSGQEARPRPASAPPFLFPLF